jgi:hypothetical protein
VGTAIERGIDAQITTKLDAGVGARDVEETGAVQRADPHIFDRLGLDRKIGRLPPPMARTAAAEPRMNFLAIIIS